MAKRVRGSRSKHLPGGQGPSHSKKTWDSSGAPETVAVSTTSDADIDMALDIVAMQATELAIEEPLTPVAPVEKPRRSRRGAKAKAKADSLTARSAAETIYVREDLRSIAVISGILLAGLIIAAVLLVSMNLSGLY